MNQASIFTLEKDSKGYKDFENLPSDIYVDTSAWICAYGSENQSSAIGSGDKRRGQSVAEFMKDCMEQDVTLYHSNLVLSEAIHINNTAYMDYLSENSIIKVPKFSDGRINYKKLHKEIVNNYPSLNYEMRESRNELLEFIRQSSISLEYYQDKESFCDIMEIIESTGGLLDTQDAIHVYVARSYKINSFLTTDGDFVLLDNDNIFTVSNERYLKEKIGRANVILEYDENQF